MEMPSQPGCVLPPKLVVYRDEEIVSLKMKRLAALIPQRPGENRPPGEAVPRGLRRRDLFS